MPKKCIVYFCEECKHFEYGFCYNTPQGQDRRKIDNEDIIPDWCPLENIN